MGYLLYEATLPVGIGSLSAIIKSGTLFVRWSIIREQQQVF
ncbi:hypothetical protein [Niabella aquatica]